MQLNEEAVVLREDYSQSADPLFSCLWQKGTDAIIMGKESEPCHCLSLYVFTYVISVLGKTVPSVKITFRQCHLLFYYIK